LVSTVVLLSGLITDIFGSLTYNENVIYISAGNSFWGGGGRFFMPPHLVMQLVSLG
jgi:predicted MPP superfamily phosphohydrolase